MSVFFEYILKISLCLGIVYIFYFLLLKRLTHYTGNRFFLMVSSVLAFFIPLVRIDLFNASQLNALPFISSIPSVDTRTAERIFIPEGDSGSFAQIIPGLFISGVAVGLMHFFIQLRSFGKIRKSGRLVGETSGVKLYYLNMNITPFSFGNAVYLNRSLHTEEELVEIIKHESVHVRQKHTIDVLTAELICILNWYNPFAWLIKHAIKQNLEFLADDAVIRNGTDKKNYQYLLLKVMGHSPLTIASNLNFSSLKKRIYMMNKTKTPKKHLLKFLFMLPVLALMILAFRDTNAYTAGAVENYADVKEETFKLSELTYSITDANVERIVKKEQSKSLLQVGKPFTITLIKNERDRLRSLLEKNGYSNISNHAISFLIDSSLTNNSFAVQVNIDLQTRISSVNRRYDGPDKRAGALARENNNRFYSLTSCNDDITQSTITCTADQHTYTTVGHGNFL